MMTRRYKPQSRVRSERLFGEIVKKGKFLRAASFNMWVLRQPNEEAGPSKFGVIVSKKTDKKATARNLWRRRFKEVFRNHQNEILQTTYIVVQAKRNREAPAYSEIEASFLELLKKNKLLKIS